MQTILGKGKSPTNSKRQPKQRGTSERKRYHIYLKRLKNNVHIYQFPY